MHLENYSVLNQKDLKNGLRAVSINYFVKNKNANIDVFWFGYMDKRNIQFERRFIELISDDAIPEYCYSATTTDSVNFAGRTLKLGGNCNWMNVNNIQCPYHGQMDWSLHNTKESADASIQNQLMATKLKNGGKVVSEEMIDIIFEGVPTKAKKVHYDFTGLTSLLASTTGGKYLTIFYVSEKVRGLYLTCVLSFWNNDTINPSGLPALLEEVMAFPEN